VLRSSFLRRHAAAGCALAWLAAVPAAAQYSGAFGKNKIQYREFDWKIYHSPHFDVYYYEEEAALLEKVVSMAESAYDHLSREFDHQIQEPVPLIFYATHSHFEQNNIILNFIPEGIGAFASPARNRMVLPVDLPDAELYELILHELTHIFQYSAIFQNKLGRGIGGAPQWFMEGMASFMAKDEGPSERMYLRDAVVNDQVPSIVGEGVGGYLAYRFGHAAFEYIEERWGKEGFRDFVYEFRNTIGGRADRALERALRIDAEDFDLDFRRWLRRKYLPALVESGEPSDFGRPFRDEDRRVNVAVSPAASPSGDLVAALAVTRGDLDLLLFDARKREPLANLTRGHERDYQYLVAQNVTTGNRMGRDLAFSPDGNYLAVFAKRERGRSLVIFDVLRRRIDRMIDMEVEQQHAPAWSPDGKTIAFSGNLGGRFDIFLFDVTSGGLTNLTDDSEFDGAPVFTPDGKGLVFSTTVEGEFAQLFELALGNPRERRRLTEGRWSDRDAVFSSDGQRIYFTSDRSGADNIWSLDRASGEVAQHTNAVTGCMTPTVLRDTEGRDRLVYAGFWKGRFDLYLSDLDRPVTEIATPAAAPAATTAAGEPLPAPREREEFVPDILVTLDDANKEEYKRSRLFLEDGGGAVGVTDDQYVLGQAYLSFSDYLGDRRLFLLFSSVDTFSNFDFTYFDLSRRWNWSLRLFDDRSFFIGFNPETGQLDREATFNQTGLVASWIYPFTFYHRVELGLGYFYREYDYQFTLFDEGQPIFVIEPREDDFPLVQAALTGDSTISDSFGPVAGRRWRLAGNYGYDTDEGGALTQGGTLDFRQYIPLTRRSQIAFRAFGGYASGNFPSVYYIGGLDDLRGYDFRALVGDRAFYGNLELRFPLVDALVGPVFDFRGIRGRIFIDVGGAWRDYDGEEYEFCDAAAGLTVGVDGGATACAAYGWGFTVRFSGLDLNWDFAQAWDFSESVEDGFRTSFWIGRRF
jgi:hypothetical protein